MSQISSAGQIVINETLARNRFGEENPVGQVINIRRDNKDSTWTVAGVVRDVRPSIRTSPSNMIYECVSLHPAQSTAIVLNFGKDPPPETESLIRRAVYKCCPDLIIVGVQTANEQLRQSVTLERQALNILRTLSLGALLLAAMGLFSVLSYNVEQRKTEFGVRLALGASPVDIVGLVLRGGVATAGVGAVIGCFAAFGLARLMASLLFQTRTFEPVVYVVVVLLFLVATVVACCLPATRAARANISRLLRAD
jgi:putative ABC transport system permease protein